MPKAKKETLTLPLLITRGLVLYPKCSQFIEVGRAFSLAAVENAQNITNSLILVVSQKNFEIDEPEFSDLYEYGTLCRIASSSQRGNSTRIKVEPLERIKLNSMHLEEFHLGSAVVDSVPEVDEELNYKITAALMAEIEKIPQIYRRLPKTVLTSLQNTNSAVTFCYIIADFVQTEISTKQSILELNTVDELYQAVLRLVLGEKIKDEVEDRIQEIIRESTDKSQKEYFLREKLKAVKQELGEGGGKNDVEKIKERLENEPFPQYVKDKINAEINKLEMMPGGSLEASLIQTTSKPCSLSHGIKKPKTTMISTMSKRF